MNKGLRRLALGQPSSPFETGVLQMSERTDYFFSMLDLMLEAHSPEEALAKTVEGYADVFASGRKVTEHPLKVMQLQFLPILAGESNFLIIETGPDLVKGDNVSLEEWDFQGGYTGRSVTKRVTDINPIGFWSKRRGSKMIRMNVHVLSLEDVR